MKQRFFLMCALVSLTGLSLLASESTQSNSSQDFQLSETLQEHAKLFNSRDRRLVFRLFTDLEVSDLRRQQAGVGDAAYSLDLVVGTDGAIEEFAINRFEESSVFQVDRDSERLRFLRLRDARTVFRDFGLVTDPLGTTSDFVYRYVTETDDTEVRELNLRVLRAIRAFDMPTGVAQPSSKPKDAVQKAESQEEISTAEDAGREFEDVFGQIADAENDTMDVDRETAPPETEGIDRLQFLEDLDQDLEGQSERIRLEDSESRSQSVGTQTPL